MENKFVWIRLLDCYGKIICELAYNDNIPYDKREFDIDVPFIVKGLSKITVEKVVEGK